MKYVIYGLGISGISAARFLAKNNEDVTCTDDNETLIGENSKKFPNIKFARFDEITFDKKTVISLAPGIPLYYPKPHKILKIAEETGATLTCDIEIFHRLNSEKKFIGITGTNGKSTTVALLGSVFNELKIPSNIGGNIGVPCFDLEQKIEDFTYIFECSSFQLDLIANVDFQIAALLNITADHIERHGSIKNYIASKKRIFKNQTTGDFAIINIDDANSKEVFLELKNDQSFKGKLIPISTNKIQENGISLFDGKLSCNFKENFTANLKSKFLHGEHNDQNMLCAFATTYCYLQKFPNSQINFSEIITAIEKFTGLAHRMQNLGEIDGIKFINDSKATNSDSSSKALQTYENIFWIVGGKSKEGGISGLKPYFKNISKAYLIGESSDEFAGILEENSVDFDKCENLQKAFENSFIDAKNSGLTKKNILLSPSCASFDQWKNFEQRGDYFCKLFNELSKSKIQR